MLFPALRWMSWALTVLPLTVMSSLAMTAAVLPAVIRLPLVSSVMVSTWSFHPVLPRLILIPTALFLLMALSVF
ncbi:unknown [Dialister invisus CAG:218]|nr:unknown [Dialister invisus CAG:218]